jgi:arylsulfatase A-like enzyme
MPTILHAAGVRGRGQTDYSERSLLPAIHAKRDDWRRPVVIQNISQKGIDGLQFEERALRTERWKLILRYFAGLFAKRANELYDMQSDPGETRNLYKERSEIVRDLARQLVQWGDEQGDDLAVKLGRQTVG